VTTSSSRAHISLNAPSRSATVDRVATGALILALAGAIGASLIVPMLSRPAMITALVGLALGAALFRRRAVVWTLFVLACLAWLAVALTPVARIAARGLERRNTVPAHVNAVVVLSGGVNDDGLIGQEAVDRLLHGMSLVRSGVSDTLLLTVYHAEGRPAITSARDELRIATLLPGGVTIMQVGQIGTTHTEAVRSAQVLPPARAPLIAVVTSPLHSYRACGTFERVGYQVVCAPSLSRDIALGALDRIRDRLLTFRMAVYERAALVEYHVRGWM
jgi:uncharacterized SAM-binding protein YcdF (DUF218 family)